MTDARQIDTAPREDGYPMLLFCPEQGGWHTGIWLNRRWVDYLTTQEQLYPSHWKTIPVDPVDKAREASAAA
jgi:hypothetical protein